MYRNRIININPSGPWILTLAVLVLVSCLSHVGAQENPEDQYHHDLDIYTRDIPSRSAMHQPGSVKIIESEFDYAYQLKVFGKLPVELSVDSQYIIIDNSTAVKLPAHLTGFTAGIETTIPVFNLNRTYFHIGLFPSFYSDNWTFDSENFRFPSKYYFIYQLNDQWIFVGGAAVYPHYDFPWSPIAGFIYKASDKLTFYLVPSRPHISYAWTDRVTLFVEGGYDSDNEFIVTRDKTKNVTLRYNEGRLGTGIKYQINKYADISLSGGAIFMNSFKYLDDGGKVVLKNGPYVELRFRLKI